MPDAEERATIARLTEETIPRLMDRLTRSELGELEVREDGWRIRLRRPTANNTAAPQAQPQSSASRGGGQTPDRASHGSAPRAPHPTRADTNRGAVASPAVGYFVGRDSVKVGATLGRGDVLGYVDVLGVRHEVVAPVDGTLRAIDVEPGQAVEYGQQLAKVEADVH